MVLRVFLCSMSKRRIEGAHWQPIDKFDNVATIAIEQKKDIIPLDTMNE
jgi:hypothetical protein